jgi:cobalt-precorrin 5A hydrolase
MGGGEGVIFAGFGCRAGCSAEDAGAALAEALRRVEAQADVTLAIPEFRAGEAGLRAAAGRRPVAVVDTDALAAAGARCVTRSAASLAARGVGSVAEAAALAAAGPGARLLVARVAVGGVTCAVAAP